MKAQYKALIIDTILKEVRSKTLIFVFVATTASILIGHMILSTIINSMGGDATISISGIDALSVNFRILNAINFILAAVFGISVIKSDYENNIIYQYLSFPISRAEYFFTRILGSWLLVMAYYAYSYLLSAILFSFTFKKMVFTSGHFLSFLVLGLYLLLVIFISVFFSLFMNKVGALFATFASCIAAAAAFGTFAKTPYAEYFVNMSAFKGVGLVLYYIFPRISFLDSSATALLSSTPLGMNLIEQIIHLVVLTAAYVMLAQYVIKKKDF